MRRSVLNENHIRAKLVTAEESWKHHSEQLKRKRKKKKANKQSWSLLIFKISLFLDSIMLSET